MKYIPACFLACALAIAALPAFAAPSALPQVAEQPAAIDPHRVFLQALADAARRHHASHHAAHRAPRVKVHEVEPEFAKATTRPIAAKAAYHADSAAIRGAEAREAAGRAARADDLYRASQTDAPIIANATACKRIGAHGESIYENCGATVAAGVGGTR